MGSLASPAAVPVQPTYACCVQPLPGDLRCGFGPEPLEDGQPSPLGRFIAR